MVACGYQCLPPDSGELGMVATGRGPWVGGWGGEGIDGEGCLVDKERSGVVGGGFGVSECLHRPE